MEAILEVRERNIETGQRRRDLLIVRSYFYAEFSHPHHRAGLLALLSASLGLTLIRRDDRYPGQLAGLLLRLVVPFRPHLSC